MLGCKTAGVSGSLTPSPRRSRSGKILALEGVAGRLDRTIEPRPHELPRCPVSKLKSTHGMSISVSKREFSMYAVGTIFLARRRGV